MRPEIDRDERAWTVPAARLKGRKGQRKRTITFRYPIPPWRSWKDCRRGWKTCSHTRGFGEDLTVHGFRSTFKDWCSEQTAYPNEMSEMALAHTVSDKVEAAYRRGDMREKRRRLMADWAAYRESPPAAVKGKVVPMRAS